MLDGEHPPQHKRNRKSVQLQLTSPPHAEEEPQFEPIPLTARSTALSFATAASQAQTPPTTTTTPGNRRRSSLLDTLTHPRQMALAAMSVISPRSGNYDRLEGGMGPSRTGPPQKGWRRFGWKKFAIGASLLIFVVWLWGPRESRIDWQAVQSGLKNKLGGNSGTQSSLKIFLFLIAGRPPPNTCRREHWSSGTEF